MVECLQMTQGQDCVVSKMQFNNGFSIDKDRTAQICCGSVMLWLISDQVSGEKVRNQISL